MAAYRIVLVDKTNYIVERKNWMGFWRAEREYLDYGYAMVENILAFPTAEAAENFIRRNKDVTITEKEIIKTIQI